jgi:hypothetical protein
VGPCIAACRGERELMVQLLTHSPAERRGKKKSGRFIGEKGQKISRRKEIRKKKKKKKEYSETGSRTLVYDRLLVFD